MDKWICTDCGYEYEGERKVDYSCPYCNKPSLDFVSEEEAEKIKKEKENKKEK